ncbi:MAG TPA: secretin and TonB N-terminal domain-containing protein [Tepidisphaeraceae bacterium]|nr:secretin and TonB N-terminal domain-containing protein [Tepidisphaeraceae bacterium]
MRNWKHLTWVFFLASMAVYSVRAKGADQSAPPSDPFATSAATQPSAPTGPAPRITLSDAGTFSIQISNDVSLVEVLRMIGSQAQISIIPSRDVRGTVPAMDLYNVTVNEALDAILRPNGFEWERKGDIIYVYSEDEMEKRNKKLLETDVYRFFYISAADAKALLTAALSPEGTITSTPVVQTTSTSSGTGGGSGGSSGGGGGTLGGDTYADLDMLVVTDHPENQERMRQIVKEIDHRPKQVLVEATILETELTENNQLGINFTALGSINFDDLGFLPATGLPSIFTPTAASTSSGAVTTDVPVGFGSKGFNAVQTGQGGLQVGIVQDNIAIFLQALESVTNTTVLSNPKVLTLDKQEGYVQVGETIYYEGGTTQTASSTTSSVTSLNTGITLAFRPFVADDGYIRMDINPSDSTPQGTGNSTLGLPPNILTNEVTTNIMVKDGRTVLIGGLFRDNDEVSKSQVPFFGNLPLAGPLFGQQIDTTTRDEIIFLLTPHIVKDDEEFSKMSEAAQRDAERLRVGVRQGMMPWGRERLAEGCYELAEDELHKPNPDLNLVKWHLDCATNLNPTFLEAINLKEKVTGEALSTADNSSIRSFVRRQILSEDGRYPDFDQQPPQIVRISSRPATQP